MRFAFLTKALADRTQTDLPSLAGYLAGRGHEVTIITGICGKCFRSPDVRVRSVPAWSEYGRFSSTFGVCALAELSRVCTPDVLLTTSDTIDLPYVAAIYKRVAQTSHRRSPRVVHLATALAPEASVATGHRPHATRLTRSLAAAGLCSADLVVVSGPDMKERILSRHPRLSGPGRVQVLPPWAVRSCSTSRRCDLAIARKLSLEGRFVVLHHGGMHKGHDAAGLATAIELTSTDNRIVWVMTHDGPSLEQLQKHHSTGHLHNVSFLPADADLSREQIAALADVQVISQSQHITGLVAPRHLPELMSWGKTIVALAPDTSTTSHILRQHHSGCVVPPGHGEILARTIWQLHDSHLQREVFGRAARYTFDKELCSDVVLPRLERMLIEGLQS